MHTPQLHLVSPEQVRDFIRAGPASLALERIAQLVGAQLTMEGPEGCGADGTPPSTDVSPLPIRYNGQTMGEIRYRTNGDPEAVALAACAMTSFLEHMLDREIAITDLADAMMAGYEELNILYTLLPNIATRIDESEIGEVLVDQTAQTLSCRRVSLLLLDVDKTHLKVAASRGLPAEVRNTAIPLSGTIAEHTLFEEGLLLVDDISQRPDLAKMSRGQYETNSFATVRVPLRARGEGLGVLAVTERINGTDFTARDRKLLEGLSAMGASALMNCRLHAAVNRQMISAIQALASAVDAKDAYTHDHSARVSQLCVATAQELGIEDTKTRREVELAGLLHDIGKIGIPDAILSKPDKLTGEEFELIKNHVKTGASIVGKVKGLDNVAKAILHHHERYDGLGYPSGLAGDAIPMASKLIAVSDTFDSLTSDRPYRKSLGTQRALSELNRNSGSQFDPAIVDAFVPLVRT